MTQLKASLSFIFYKGIYFIKCCVIIYLIFFQDRSNVKWIPKIEGNSREKTNNLNFKEKNYLKLQHCLIMKLQFERFLNFFKI